MVYFFSLYEKSLTDYGPRDSYHLFCGNNKDDIEESLLYYLQSEYDFADMTPRNLKLASRDSVVDILDKADELIQRYILNYFSDQIQSYEFESSNIYNDPLEAFDFFMKFFINNTHEDGGEIKFYVKGNSNYNKIFGYMYDFSSELGVYPTKGLFSRLCGL
jgi:hypothetical protein